MTEFAAAFGRYPDPIRSILVAFGSGALPPDVALMQLILATRDADDLDRILRETRWLAAPGHQEKGSRLKDLYELAQTQPNAWATVRAAAAAVPHDKAPGGTVAETLAHWAERFDAAAKISPEASVALYSLGDPQRLAAATAEIVAWMREAGLLGPDRKFLDIGCGIGRLERALSGEVGGIVGIDISPEMVSVARQRCAGLDNVEIRLTSGLNLADFPDGCFDCAVAVDSFPYLVAAGGDLVDVHFREIARVLRDGGDLLVLNYSYSGDLERDRADIGEHASAAGFRTTRNGARPFRSWDGAAFQFVRQMGR